MSQSERMSVEVVEPKLFAGTVADEISASLADAVSERGSASLVLAGGSTPGAVYRALGLPPRVEEVPWNKLRLYMGDERWVQRGDVLSNFRMIEETLLANLKGYTPPKVFPVDTSLPDAAEEARRYAELVRRGEHLNGSQFPIFDVVLLGMGADGHIASLFPGSPFLAQSARAGPDPVVVAVQCPQESGKPGGTRVTFTPQTLCRARRIIFMVAGEGKSGMVQRVLEGSDRVEEVPARLVTEMKGFVSWYLDSAAAKDLKG